MPIATSELDLMYAAYFNRPADVGGLNYWEQQHAQGASVESIAYSFGRSQEYQTLTAGKSSAEVVDMAYHSLFGRASDDAGRAWWAAQIDSGKLDNGSIVLEIMHGAQAADQLALYNRGQMAQVFTDTVEASSGGASAYTVPAAFDVAHAWLEPISGNPFSLIIGQSQLATAVAAAIAAGQAKIHGNVDNAAMEDHAYAGPAVDAAAIDAAQVHLVGVPAFDASAIAG